MSLWNEEELKKFNDARLRKLQEEVDALRKQVKFCDPKEPIKNSNIFCPNRFYCLK